MTPRVGVNFWQAMWLGAADRARLGRELDLLAGAGVTDLRLMAGAEGPDGAPERVVPALSPAPGAWDASLLEGLDVALSEIGSRGMRAILCLTNFWSWSGGLAQYRAWATGDAIPYPSETGSFAAFERFSAGFYREARARELFAAHVERLAGRRNAVTGRSYADDATILAWEICNEPRGKHDPEGMRAFLAETASQLRALGVTQPVATGSEGETADPTGAGLDFTADHAHEAIGVATCHLWPQNWGLWDPARDDDETFEQVLEWSRAYLRRHAEAAAGLGKPLLLEELGLARDGGSHDPRTTTRRRDRFFQAMLEEAARLCAAGTPVEAVLFWSWAGDALPRQAGEPWREGEPLGGDPPHEPEGWYGIFSKDRSTLEVMSRRGAPPGHLC